MYIAENTSSQEAGLYIAAAEPTPLGPVWVAVTSTCLACVDFADSQEAFVASLRRQFGPQLLIQTASAGHTPACLSAAVAQIQEYLAGQRQDFDLPIDWSFMRPFQEAALRLTYAIPYGVVTTYGELASRMGKPKAARAVGRAEATNPIPLVIPCHRVIGRDGELHGYGGRGGIPTKAWLLKMEQGQGENPATKRKSDRV